ncbi:MAG TPA: sigma-70 family RNA polymerase sigma factor [Acidimicrobiia bacterium]|nr:sigma-70 family RNA polymerase sigma factor [Acidimicrobiia bacterium]
MSARPDPARAAIEAVWRIESARIVGVLTRYTGDFGLAEDVAQEALAEALVSWPDSGVPDNPAAWLLTTARRRAIDAFRRNSLRDDRYASLARDAADRTHGQDDDLLWDPDALEDDVLALMFVSCHPILAPEARIALTLRTVGGLSSDEIARAFLIPVPTVQARITRAKKSLAAAGVPFAVPPVEKRGERLGSVLNVIYVIFTEGSSATSGDGWIRHDLAREALRLARVLARLQPVPEAHGLLALLELTSARFPARIGGGGQPILLEDQDRRRWDRSAIARGRAALRRAAGPNGLGAYGLQAAIAECHDVASSVAGTDWERIVLLYEALRRLAPSPVVELNHAVAVSMASGPDEALALVDALALGGALTGYHPLHVVRAELLVRLGRPADARGEFLRAAEMCTNQAERGLLERKAAAAAVKLDGRRSR